jgi:Skp family chaperone for outer membrane proteins
MWHQRWFTAPSISSGCLKTLDEEYRQVTSKLKKMSQKIPQSHSSAENRALMFHNEGNGKARNEERSEKDKNAKETREKEEYKGQSRPSSGYPSHS